MKLRLKVGLILLVAFLIRVWGLDKLPIELFGDELDAGYQAYSVLKTGRDYLGHTLPLNFHSFSETREPLFIYSLVPSVAVFGLNEWGVRVAPAVWGALSILVFFLVVWTLVDEKTALLGTGLMAITPWHWHYSRAGFEVTLLLLLVLLGVLFWLKSQSRSWFLIPAIFSFFLAALTYSSAVSFVPLLALLLFLLFRPENISSKVKTLSLLLIFVGSALFLVSFLGQPGERLSSVGLWSSKDLSDETSFKRLFDKNEIAGELFHNKVVLFIRETTANYLKSFSPQFLAVGGDSNPAHSEVGGGFGELFHVEYLLAILGVGVFVARRAQKVSKLFLGWLVISPLSSSITYGGGEHATRLFLMIPPLLVAAAVGFWVIVGGVRNLRRRELVKVIILGGMLIEVIFFVHHVVFHYRIESWRAWQYGYKEAIRSLPESGSQMVAISYKSEPTLIRYIFWARTDPSWFQRNFTGDRLITNVIPNFDGFWVGRGLLFGNLEDNVSLTSFLKPGMAFVGIQGKDIPGDLVFDERSGVKMLSVVRDPLFLQPLIQVIEKK